MADKLSDIFRGDTKRYRISIPGTDLTNDTFFLCFKLDATDDDPGVFQVKKVVATDTDPLDDPTEGVVYLVAPSTETANLTPGIKYYVGIQWVKGNGDVKTLLVNKIKCKQDINISVS